MTDKAYAVPLHELLANVPRSARLEITDPDGMGTRFIPVGRYCHEAAEALRAALAQLDLPNRFNPDWDAMAVMVEEQQRMAKRIEELTQLVTSQGIRLMDAEAQPEQEPVAFYVYKPTLPRGNLGNVADGDLPWIYDQDPSSGYSAKMLVYPASSAQGENNETNARASD